MTASHHYPQPRGSHPHDGPPHHRHHSLLFPNSSLISCILPHLTPLDQPIQRFPLSCQRTSGLPPPPSMARGSSPVDCVALLSLLFLHRSFHLVGSLNRPVVAAREPKPRPQSLAPPPMQCTQSGGGGGGSPVQTGVLMRANSFPSDGLRFPVLPAGEARLIGYLQDGFGPRL